jgi:hypothetical protein
MALTIPGWNCGNIVPSCQMRLAMLAVYTTALRCESASVATAVPAATFT